MSVGYILGDGFLTADGIDSDDASGDLKELKQFGDSGDFIGMIICFYLSKDKTVLASPGAD